MKTIDFIKQRKVSILFLAIAFIMVAAIFSSRSANQKMNNAGDETQTVSLINVDDYRQENSVELDSGTVESLGQAELKSQLSAPIAKVNVVLGDRVAAGQILVELKNDDIKAQLDQAQAGQIAAQARLDEVVRGARPEDLQISKTSLEQAQNNLLNSVKDAYAKSDDAIHNHIDKFFANPRQSNAEFQIIVNAGTSQSTFEGSNPELADNMGHKKYEIEKILENWQIQLAGLNPSNIEANVSLAKQNLQAQIDFLNEMAPLVNSISTDNATYKQTIDGYKTEFSAARSTISGSQSSLNSSETSWKASKEALTLKEAGASSEQIKQAQAAAAQAKASVASLEATLEKTAIRSPIDGKISQISGRVGELATPGQLIASIVNPDALRVKTYISENDLSLVSENDPVTINGTAKGIVQTIAPAINPQTKKIEVNIIVTENSQKPAIIAGQNVSLKIANRNNKNNTYLLPIQAVQFSGGNNYVFTVDNGLVKQVPVTTAELVGENVEVVNGLQSGTKIISSVRGLEAGEKVNIQN